MLSGLLYLAIFCAASSNSELTRDVSVTIDTNDIINVVDERFLSYTVDTSAYLWKSHIDFSSSRLRTLMRHLSPAVMRVGGAAADVLIYNETTSQKKGIMTWDNITALIEVTRATGARLLFDLNHQNRDGDNWNTTNVEKLFKFCSQMDYCNDMDWELGNEPEWYNRKNKTVLTPRQIGSGYVTLHAILKGYDKCRKSSIFGPAVGRVTSYLIRDIFSRVIVDAGSFMKAATIHHYYFRGPGATKETYMNASYFADLPNLITKAYSLIAETKNPGVPLWFSETSTGYGSGTVNVSDRFVSGFLWLEKLGIAAATGAKVVCRQNLYRSNYALIDGDFNPLPDYWLSWLHKKLVGQKVFAVNVTGLPTPPTTRVYAHCTNKACSSYQTGAVTVFALNVDTITTSTLKFADPFASQSYDSYLFEPDVSGDVLSKLVKLNGKTLAMPSDVTMPEIVPIRQPAGSPFSLPPATMAFFVFQDACFPLCH